MPNSDIPKILTFTIAPIFSMFSADQSAKVYTNKAPFKNKSQFNQS